MKLCLMSCMLGGASPQKVVETAVACGISAVDWTCSRQYAPPRDMRVLCEDHGLKIAAHTILGSKFLDRAPDALDDFKRSLEFAVELHAPILMLPPFSRVNQISQADDRQAWIEFYAEILPLTQAAGITLTLESTGFASSPITTADEALEVLHAVPGLKCTLDHGNMETAEPSINAYVKLRDYVVNFHLKDWKIFDAPHPDASRKRNGRYFANAVIGEGDMPLKAFWDTVDAAGRELYVNLETMDFYQTSSTEAVLKKTANLLRNW